MEFYITFHPFNSMLFPPYPSFLPSFLILSSSCSFSTTRTRVIDDESDYFSVDTNSWLSVNERDILQERDHELREKKYGSRRNRGVVLDISGRKVIEEEPSVSEYHHCD